MKRIPALDSIRGLLLVIMTINHLIWISGGQSALQYFTLQPLGQFGAAEGFILISGLLAGAVYSRRELSDGEAKRKVWHRAFTIYKYHVASLFVVMLWFTFCVAFLPSLSPVFGASFNNLTETPLLTVASVRYWSTSRTISKSCRSTSCLCWCCLWHCMRIAVGMFGLFYW